MGPFHLIPNPVYSLPVHALDGIMALVLLCAMADYVSAPESWLCNPGSNSPLIFDWSLFRSNAANTYHLSWSEPKDCCMSCFRRVSGFLRSSSIGADIIPSLRSIKIKSDTAHGLSGIQQWLSSTIQSLTIEFGPKIDHNAVILFLAEMTRNTHLECLILSWDSMSYTPGQTYDISRHLAGICKNLMRLRDISIPMDLAHVQLLDILSTLPNLQNITFSPRISHDVIQVLHRAGGFKRLRKLVITDLSANRNIIRSINGRSLQILHATNALPDSLHSIAQLCLNLRELFIQVPFEDFVDILPLSSCKNLEILQVRAHQPLVYNDDHLLDLLGSWPNIQNLSLNPRPLCNVIPGRLVANLPTLHSLVAAAQSGPNLRHLGIYLDARGHLNLPSPVMTWELLDSLDLGVSTCGCNHFSCEAQVAESLARLFPHAHLEVNDESSAWVTRLALKLEEVTELLR